MVISEGSGRAGRGKEAWLLSMVLNSVCAPWEFRVFWVIAQEQTGKGTGWVRNMTALWKLARNCPMRL